MRPRLIISSGRCGSTLLSTLLGRHPDVVALQEFFISLYPAGLAPRTATAEEFWNLLNGPLKPVNTLLDMGVRPPELPAEHAVSGEPATLTRFGAFTQPALPWDRESGPARLKEAVAGFPERELAEHYRGLFEVLASLSGRTTWIERSGGSSLFAGELCRMFPDARVVHLTRDWLDTARSMSRHPVYQLSELRVGFVQECGTDPFTSADPVREHCVPARLRRFLPDRLTPEALEERGRSLIRYVLGLAMMDRRATQALETLGPGQVLRLSYEDLVADPREELGRVARFFELDHADEWARRESGAVRAPEPGALEAQESAAQRARYEPLYQRVVRTRAG